MFDQCCIAAGRDAFAASRLDDPSLFENVCGTGLTLAKAQDRQFEHLLVRGELRVEQIQLTVRFDTRPEHVSNVANAAPHDAGEAFEYLYGGGGGWGDPLERDPAKVLEDVRNELVSVEAAASEYGVHVDTARWAVRIAWTSLLPVFAPSPLPCPCASSWSWPSKGGRNVSAS